MSESGAPPYAARLSAPPGRVRLGTLTVLRWFAVAGQSFAVLLVQFGLQYDLPLAPCVALIAASVILNIVSGLRQPAARRLSDAEITAYLAFDQMQLALLLFFTGGIENPFALLFLAPAAIAASSLNLRRTIGLGMLSFALVTLLAVYHYPVPWEEDHGLALPTLYIGGLWIALVLGIGFTTTVAFRVAAEATRMSAALGATQLALAREQKLSALGALAAAAAHELGTPLGTIQLVAKELKRAAPAEGPQAEDLKLLLSQVERCRDILGSLAAQGEGDTYAVPVPLPALLNEMAAPFQFPGVEIVVTAPRDAPEVIRSPELQHGLANLIENAADFAGTRVELAARWDDQTIVVSIIDDGPGFAPEILNRLGEPYVTTRPGRAALTEEDLGPSAPEEEAREGMGLGFFIAKTLLERTGARVTFGNRTTGGAQIDLVWPRRELQVRAPKGEAAAAPGNP